MRATATVASKAGVLRERLHHYYTLLAAELFFTLVYPFFVGAGTPGMLARMVSILMILAAIYVVLGRGLVTKIALVLGVPAIFLHFIAEFEHFQSLDLVAIGLGVVFLAFVTSVLVKTIVSNPSVTTDTLAGAVSAYMLVGITFGMAYALIYRISPGAFRDTVEPGKHFANSEFTFFSFVTLTTVGYGDIVPWAPFARALAMLESVIGIMYPALLISRVVAMHGRRHEETEGT